MNDFNWANFFHGFFTQLGGLILLLLIVAAAYLAGWLNRLEDRKDRERMRRLQDREDKFKDR